MKLISKTYEESNRDYRFVAILNYHTQSFTIHREGWLETMVRGQYAWVPYTAMLSVNLNEFSALMDLLERLRKLLHFK